MIYLHTLGGASIEIESTHRCADAEGASEGEGDGCASPRIAERARLTPSAPRRFALLLYLAVERGRRVSRERLQTLIFPEQSPTKARHSLREVIYQLRAAGASILTDHDDVFVPGDQVWCDAWAAVEQDPLSEETVHAIAGGFLTGYAPEHSEAYTEWYEAHRATSISSLARRLLAATTAATNEAQWEFAEGAARACLAIDPLNEGATLALAGILAVNGSKASAIDLVDRYVAEIGSQSAELKFPAMALKRRISEGLPSRHLVQRRRNGDSGDSVFITPAMVGRAKELAELQEMFGRARTGASQCVVVAGDAGIGKTRLAAEFSATAVLQGARVERVTIQPHDGERPMGAFVDLVPALLRARGALGCSPASMDALQNLIGRQPQGDTPQQAAGAEEHEQRWAAVSRAVVDLCEAIASEGTLVLVIEDAHWLDTLSANTIGRIIGAGREARILVVATTRDPRPLVRDMRLAERCRTVTLGPLDDVATKAILDVVLPTPGKPANEKGAPDGGVSVRTRIAEVSAGNPLFLISLAAHSRAHPGEFKVPGTIVETFAQRIDALSRRAVSVLATCSELGKHSTLGRVVRSLEMRKHELVESLLELTESGLVLRDDQNAVPAHPLVAEALRNRLPQPARRAVAHAVAATLEVDAESGDSPSLWWDAAESWRAGNNPERAINALRRCARHALEIGRPGEAARILNEAAKLPQSLEGLRAVSEDLVRSASAANDAHLVLRAAELRHTAVTNDAHDDLEMAELRAAIRADLSSNALERLLKCVCTDEAPALHRVEAAIVLLKASDTLGSDTLREGAASAISPSDLSMVPPLKRLEFTLFRALATRDWDQTSEIAREILSQCDEKRDGVNAGYATNSGLILMYSGCYDEAKRALERGYEMALDMGSAHSQLTAAMFLATLTFDLGLDGEYEYWSAKVAPIVREAPHLARDFDFIVGRAIVELHKENAALAEAALSEGDAAEVYSTPVRARFRKALELGISVLRRRPSDSDEALARTMVVDRLHSLNGLRDQEVYVGCQVLAARGEEQFAAETLRRFLHSERGHLAPLSPGFARVMKQVGVSVPPNLPMAFAPLPRLE